MKNTAATTGMELIRRIVGMAKVKDITSIEDSDKRVRAEKMCLAFAKDCIMNKNAFLKGDDYMAAILKVIKAS